MHDPLRVVFGRARLRAQASDVATTDDVWAKARQGEPPLIVTRGALHEREGDLLTFRIDDHHLVDDPLKEAILIIDRVDADRQDPLRDVSAHLKARLRPLNPEAVPHQLTPKLGVA